MVKQKLTIAGKWGAAICMALLMTAWAKAPTLQPTNPTGFITEIQQ